MANKKLRWADVKDKVLAKVTDPKAVSRAKKKEERDELRTHEGKEAKGTPKVVKTRKKKLVGGIAASPVRRSPNPSSRPALGVHGRGHIYSYED